MRAKIDVGFEKGRWRVDQRPVVVSFKRGQNMRLKSPSRLTECLLDLRDADVDSFQHIGVHGLRSAPKTQCIQFLLQNYVKFAQRDKLTARRFCDSNTVQEILGTLPVVCKAPWPRVL